MYTGSKPRPRRSFGKDWNEAQHEGDDSDGEEDTVDGNDENDVRYLFVEQRDIGNSYPSGPGRGSAIRDSESLQNDMTRHGRPRASRRAFQATVEDCDDF